MSRILWDTLSSTTLSRCWPILICTGIWSSVLCFLNQYTHGKLSIQPDLITVFGTVLGFVISFRTTSSFDRYNDGRRYWSQIVLNCRIFARTVWFHVPDNAMTAPGKIHTHTEEEQEAMTLIEKKTVVNLLEAYAISVKHYLRGEEGIHYQDLYPLVPFLYSSNYPFPAIIPLADLRNRKRLPQNISLHRPPNQTVSTESTLRGPASPNETVKCSDDVESQTFRNLQSDELLPAEWPPRYCWRSAFPLPFLHWIWKTLKGGTLKVESQKPYPAKYNVPLEISLYLASYISALQVRGVLNDPTLNMLYATLNQLVDALNELERVITTPIPVSYSLHLWMVTTVYCGTLPFQLWSIFQWFTVPASVIASFVFFGFIVAGEEIESYDKNDLNMGSFVDNIIRNELHAITAMPAPDPEKWAMAKNNNFLSMSHASMEPPSAWLNKGKAAILEALHRYVGRA
ncbi:UPF0187-domain-containing protein [Rhizopogon vinicolor AM-OR11-026]|uniref:UPF0187-domain-containing protein n=1 Tax=Rhizopogon vinicolor AM-OR11-026 TaxID=1314800 RepID=A0A1B7MM13_9AGAM|nr:UPF0187-domain-containing protein [Rhizopogon vinicolor AM-OR11-026]